MQELDAIADRWGDSDVLAEFSLPEIKAFVDLAYLVMMADHEITDQEAGHLREQLNTLPFANKGQATEALGDHLARTRKVVGQILGARQKVDRYIDRATARITEADHRAATMQVLSLISFADEPHENEADLFYRIGRSFGFERDRIEEAWKAAHT